ncbi:type II secretion system F family protein [Idiomarina seosinensis]|uniref:type II secretion system F family protein n=1 Tax=Idiomarina seosinensis TaxID=281739 RepID=UPI00384B0CB7
MKRRTMGRRRQRLLFRALQQLAILLRSGLPLNSALGIVQSQYKQGPVTDCLQAMQQAIAEGRTMSSGLRQLRWQLPAALTSWLDLAEQSGQLAKILENLVTEFQYADNQRRQLRKIIQYPLLVLAVSVAVTLILLIWVLPQFASLFTEQQLPALTRSLLSASRRVDEYGIWLVIILVISSFTLAGIRRLAPGLCQKWLLRLPGIGKLVRLARLQQLFLPLSLLLSSGMPAVTALQQVARTSPWQPTKTELNRVQLAINAGESWSAAFAQAGLRQPLLLAYLKTGEQSGLIAEMMHNLATDLAHQLQQASEQWLKLAEPLLMLILGGIIGTLLVAMYLPIFNLGQHLS